MSQYVTNIEEMLDTSVVMKISQASNAVSREAQWLIFRIVLILSDVLMIGIAFRFAYWIRFELSWSIFQDDAINSIEYYQLLTFIFIPIWLILFGFHGLYQKKNLLGGINEYDKVFRASSFGILLIIILGFLVPTLPIARGWLTIAWPLVIFIPILNRFSLRRVVYHLRRYGYFLTPAIIVGGNAEGRWLAEQLVSWRTSGLLIIGFVDEKVRPGTLLFRNLYSLGTVNQLDEIIKKYNIGEVILATSAISSRNKQMEIFKKYGVSGDVCVRMSSGLYEIITTGLTVSAAPYRGRRPTREFGNWLACLRFQPQRTGCFDWVESRFAGCLAGAGRAISDIASWPEPRGGKTPKVRSAAAPEGVVATEVRPSPRRT